MDNSQDFYGFHSDLMKKNGIEHAPWKKDQSGKVSCTLVVPAPTLEDAQKQFKDYQDRVPDAKFLGQLGNFVEERSWIIEKNFDDFIFRMSPEWDLPSM